MCAVGLGGFVSARRNYSIADCIDPNEIVYPATIAVGPIDLYPDNRTGGVVAYVGL